MRQALSTRNSYAKLLFPKYVLAILLGAVAIQRSTCRHVCQCSAIRSNVREGEAMQYSCPESFRYETYAIGFPSAEDLRDEADQLFQVKFEGKRMTRREMLL